MAPDGQPRAYYFDGISPVKHPADVVFSPTFLRIIPLDGTDPLDCPYDGTRRIQPYDPPEHLALRPNDRTGARLILVDPSLIAQFKERAPAIHTPPVLRRSRLRRWGAIAGTLAALAVILFLVVPLLSSVVAFIVPESTKRAVGKSAIEQSFAAAGLCQGERGRAVLDKLSGEIAGVLGVEQRIDIHVSKLAMANAFALPGHQMVITSKLIEQAGSSAELAGVVAHEIGHMKLSHPTEAYFRRGLIAAVADALFGGGFIGGGGLASTTALAVTFSYSREAEREADALAVEAMNRLGISGDGLIDMLSRLEKADAGLGGALSWLSSHPSNEERIRALKEGATGRNQPLDLADWRAVKSICRS